MERKSEKGSSLLIIAILMVILGIGTMAITEILQQRAKYEKSVITQERAREIQTALSEFRRQNQFYPAPAPLTAEKDTAFYGQPVTSDFQTAAANIAGTFQVAGRDGEMVRTGTVPIRALGLPDTHMTDGYGHRFIYSVTEDFSANINSVTGDPILPDFQIGGAIGIYDPNGNSLSSSPDILHYILISHSDDINGAYNHNGMLVSACDNNLPSGENCNYNVDVTFMNSIVKSTAANSFFTQNAYYQPVFAAEDPPCPPAGKGPNLFNDIGILLDSSGSMSLSNDPNRRQPGLGEHTCPPELGEFCTRLDVGHWAIRRAIPAMLQQKYQQESPGRTFFSGWQYFMQENARNMDEEDHAFVDSEVARLMNEDMEDILFEDGSNLQDYEDNAEDFFENARSRVEDTLDNFCPPEEPNFVTNDARNGNPRTSVATPLGAHINALAQTMGDGTEDAPNKIIVIADGENNQGADPVDVVRSLKETHPNLIIDVIDMVGGLNLAQIAEETGGTHYVAADAENLLENIKNSIYGGEEGMPEECRVPLAAIPDAPGDVHPCTSHTLNNYHHPG